MSKKQKKKQSLQTYGSAIQIEDEKRDQFLTRKEKEEKFKNKFTPVHMQEVRDEKGRRRFHGAFTGGWSAGYYNSVGTEEGWTPSAFKSSRGEKKRSQRPEDYMDEEDKIDLGLGTDIVANSNYYAIENVATGGSTTGGAIPGFVPDDIFSNKNVTIGKKLLNRMGWRDGQGIGKKQKKEVVNAVDDSVGMFKFAPKDVEIVTYKFKDNLHGVGYNPHLNAPEFSMQKEVQQKGSSRMQMNSIFSSTKDAQVTSFGYGALEEPDDYANIYDDENLEEYDNELDFANAQPVEEKVVKKQRNLVELEFSTDGKRVLDGFSKAKIFYTEKIFKTLRVPRDFRKKHDWKGIPGPGAPKPHELLHNKMMISQTFEVMTANMRGRLLGAKKLEENQNVPKLEERKSRKILGGEIKAEEMFPDNEEKNNRYKTWIKIQKGILPHNTKWYDGLTYRDTVSENEEFKRIWGRFQPLTGILGERFSSGTVTIPGMKLEIEEVKGPEKVVLKRFVKDWAPENLLCKRFNIKNPNAGVVANPQIQEISKFMQIDALSLSINPEVGIVNAEEIPETEEKEVFQLTSIEDNDEAIEDIAKPGMDIFSSIFGDSSDDSAMSTDDIEPMAILEPNPIPKERIRVSPSPERKQERIEIVPRQTERKKSPQKDTYFEQLKKQAREQSTVKVKKKVFTVMDMEFEPEDESSDEDRRDRDKSRKRKRKSHKKHKHKHKKRRRKE